MGLQSKNYEILGLSGTCTSGFLGDGITANTVHQIFCSSAGTITITAMGGGTLTWAATPNLTLDIVPSQTVTNSGTFFGFRSKNEGRGYGVWT